MAALTTAHRRAAGARKRSRRLLIGSVVMATLVASLTLHAAIVPCARHGTDTRSIAAAMAAIQRSVDPCGESGQLLRMIDSLKRCVAASYQICTDATAQRNVFDRPVGPRTITWNPKLRSALEASCDDPASASPVLRDPVASLVHELAHAAQDCAGLNPGEHELEAVRIENIYRRAAGLQQRQAYGDEPLRAETVKTCTPTACTCGPPDGTVARPVGAPPVVTLGEPTVSSGDSSPPDGAR